MAALTLEEVTEALATCEVCRHEFQEEGRAPLLLPDCRHVFCAVCVETIAAGGKRTRGRYHSPDRIPGRRGTDFREFPCPKCRKTVRLEGHSGVGGLSKDIITMNALNFVSMKKKVLSSGVPCSDCPDKATAICRCPACCLNLCDKCQEAHRRLPRTRTHKVVDLQTLMKSTENFMREDDPCALHEDKRYEYYCNTCQAPLCVTCALVTHQGHKMDELDGIYKGCRSKNQELLQQLDGKIKQLQNLKTQQERMRGKSKSTRDKVERDINEMFRKISSDLEERRKELSASCATELESDLAQTTATAEAVTSLMEDLQETAEMLRNAERMTRPAEFISWQRDQLPLVQEKLDSPDPHLPRPRDIHLVQSGLHIFQRSVDCLGSVRDSTAGPTEPPPVSENLRELFKAADRVQDVQLNDEDLVFDYVTNSERKLAVCKMAPVSPSAHMTFLQCPSFDLHEERLNATECVMRTSATLCSFEISDFITLSEQRLVHYPGTVGCLGVPQGGGAYWEAEVKVSLLEREVRESSLVAVELAVAPGDSEDREEQVGRGQGWGVEVGVCRDLGSGLCLWGMTRGRVVCHTPLTDDPVSSEERSPTQVTLGLLLAKGRLTVYDVTRRRRLCVMPKVNAEVVPWFGLWNKDHFRSQVSLVTGGELQMTKDKLCMLAADL